MGKHHRSVGGVYGVNKCSSKGASAGRGDFYLCHYSKVVGFSSKGTPAHRGRKDLVVSETSLV